ncbi:carbonic anhydrase [Roseomonas sp. HJA6]|uniref:carbonic anhydrase n=2 Tax=Roseomonas alba TaxID=2846776 RepID=A0ABS7A440_9PROT|nr:carbonic anhydrase [Neoroseomonas alba]
MRRRGLFAMGGVALSIVALPRSGITAQPFAGQAGSPDDAIRRLIEGNARYVANTLRPADHAAGRAVRAAGQRPFAAIVACSDSRVVPELIFDQGPGDLFVIRVAGNFINDDALATLEYGAAVLGISAIMVLGHASCGAVGATIDSIRDNALPPGHLPNLVNAIRPAVYDVMPGRPNDLLAAAIAENARRNAGKAATAAPILSGFHASGRIRSVAAVYEIASGKVELL